MKITWAVRAVDLAAGLELECSVAKSLSPIGSATFGWLTNQLRAETLKHAEVLCQLAGAAALPHRRGGAESQRLWGLLLGVTSTA